MCKINNFLHCSLASYSALTSPDLRPPDFIEGFTPLEIDGPPSKRQVLYI